MAYAPGSEKSQTRYSTPEPDLDDHRFQAESLPPAPAVSNQKRRGTLASIVDADRPQRPTLSPTGPDYRGSTARDFEHAIDDAFSIRSTNSKRSGKLRSADDDRQRERRTSNEASESITAARRANFRRALRNRTDEDNASARSHMSDASSSLPNSVDAFARTTRKGRAGTVNSKAISISQDESLHRTVSNATHQRRRPTLDEGIEAARSPVLLKSGATSRRSSVEDDVCFPPEEPPNTYTIDFEDLEEFISQAHTKTPVAHQFAPSYVKQNEQQKRTSQDLRNWGHSNGSYRGEEKRGSEGTTRGSAHVDVKVANDDDVDVDVDDDALHRVPSSTHQINRWTFFSSEIDETIHAPELAGLLMPGETFRELFELGPQGGVWWLDMLNPTEEEIFAICNAFRVHPLTREDITTQETREKVELFKSYYFLCFRSFYALGRDSDDYLEPINIYAVVFREGLLTFSFCQNNHAAQVRKRIGRLRDYVNLSADWICYALIDEIVDAFGPILGELEIETDTIEDSVFTARFEDSRNMLKQIGECRKRIMALTRLLGGKADVIRSFAKKCNEAYGAAPRGDVGLYLSDVQDHIVTMGSNLGHFEKMLGRSHTNHLAQITLQTTEQGSRANELLGKITVLATVLVPMNLIAGLFGMNVHVPGQGGNNLGWWFGIVGVIFTFLITSVIIAKRFRFI